MGVVGALTLARLRHRPARWLLLAAGVALALALPVVSAATGRVVAARALGAAVDALPAGERTVVASYGGATDPQRQQRDDVVVRAGLARLTDAAPVRQMLFGELADAQGVQYRLAASDALASQVRLTSGRLPQSCTPARCEVIETGDGPMPRLDPALGLMVVGTGVRADPLLLPGTFDPGTAEPVLLGADASTMQRLEGLITFPRGAGWVAPLDSARVTSLGVPAYADLSRHVDDELSLQVQALVLTAPDDALLREDARASSSRGRFALLGGTSAVLALGFVLVAAVGLRREHLDAAGLLRRRGATRGAVGRFALLGASITVVAGAVAGALAGWAVGWGLASTTPLSPPPTAVATASLADALPWLVALALLAVVLTTTVLVWPPTRERTAWHVVELLAAVCVAAAALVAARGAVGVATVGGDPLSIALPLLVLAAAALITARLWVPVASVLSRHLPGDAVAARLAAAAGVRRPLRTAVTAGFVTASVGALVFAGSYRSTLLEGGADTAAFDVPTTARLVLGPQGADPVALTVSHPLPAAAYPVLRSTAGVRTSATSADAVALVGVDPASFPSIARWDRTVGGSSPAEASDDLAAAAAVPGIALGPGPIALPVASWTRSEPIVVDVVAWVAGRDGLERGVPLTLQGGALRGDRPAIDGPLALTGLTMRESPGGQNHRAHRSGEGHTQAPDLAGRLVVGLPQGSTGGWSVWSSRTADVTADGDRLALDYVLAGPIVVVRPGLVDRPPLRVLVDPATAARGTSLALDLGTGDAVPATVVGTLPRWPATGSRFVVADRASLAAALDDRIPGSGAAREVWVAAQDAAPGALPAPVADALRAAPYDQLVVTTQEARRTALESDAVAQGAAWLLVIAAAVALLVALLSLVLLVVGERRDDAGQLFAQEADGTAPSTLRRSLWWRAAAVALPGLLAGTLAGLLLTRSVAALVALSAGGTAPVPPLLPVAGGSATAVALGAGAVVALAVCAVVAGRMLRGAWPERPDQDLR